MWTNRHATLDMRKTKNYIQRARLVKDIVDNHFEPGAHRGCLRYVWRVYVHPVYPMSEPTFYRMVEFMQGIDGFVGKGSNRIEKPKCDPPDIVEDPMQLKLF